MSCAKAESCGWRAGGSHLSHDTFPWAARGIHFEGAHRARDVDRIPRGGE